MSLFQPSGPLTMSNNRRPITTAPLSAVACSRISVSTASCCMTHVWSSGASPSPCCSSAPSPVTNPSSDIVMSAITFGIRAFLTSSWVLATSCGGVERWVLEDAGPVLDQLDAAVEGAVVDHLEGDVRVAVVDAFCSRGAGDHREHHDPEAINESGSQQRPAQADASDRAHEARVSLLHRPDCFDRVIAHERGVGPRERLLERGGEHHLRRSRESVDGPLPVRGELVRSRWGLAGGEARHQSGGVRSHEVGDLGLLAEPGEVLGSFQPPPSWPALRRRVAVEGGDEVDEEFWHGRVLVLGCQVAAPAVATPAVRGWTGGGSRTHRQRAAESAT